MSSFLCKYYYSKSKNEQILYLTSLKIATNFLNQGHSETLSNQAFEGVKFVTIVNASDIFGKFFDVNFFIFENVIPQIPLSVIYQNTRPSFAQQKMHLLGIYAVVNQITLL